MPRWYLFDEQAVGKLAATACKEHNRVGSKVLQQLAEKLGAVVQF
ncbi:MAG: hypothetical protein AAF004_08685 [Pseudomonadota bacterium]